MVNIQSKTMLNWCILLIGVWCTMASTCYTKTITTELTHIDYSVSVPYTMNMSETSEVAMTLNFDKGLLPKTSFDKITVFFQAKTLSPQFDILDIDEGSRAIHLTRRQLETSNFSPKIKIKLHASYIGHALVRPIRLVYENGSTETNATILSHAHYMDLQVSVVQYEGIWGTIFIVSVSAFIIVSYINLGAQLDTENIQQIMAKPKTIIIGFLVTVSVMPLISWLAGRWLLGDQLLFRMGSYIFACGPTASASTLWTVMLDSDKELSVGLQVVSTLGALASMPLLLFWMETALHQEGANYTIKVPYVRLLQTLLVLLFALFVGWRFVGRNARAQKISREIFRPLTFFVLIFIVVFSSIVYWHIYKMFDWNITLNSLAITLLTYCITGLLGYLINCNIEHAIAISITSAYKNSGIAFAVLLVAFGPPDTYIAYVPCLTQVVTTSISLYLVYCFLALVKCVRRRNQPNPIQAQAEDQVEEEPAAKRKELRSGSNSTNKSEKDEENDEFIAMNVTDVMPGSPTSLKTGKTVEQSGD